MDFDLYQGLYKEFILVFLSGSGLTALIGWFRNRIQKMECHYTDDDIISRVPVTTEAGAHQNIFFKEFKLINTTNRDIKAFKIIFEFGADSKIVKASNFSKVGKDELKPLLKKDNECSYKIKNFNRDDSIKFTFDIANITTDEFSITEADCVGFRIVSKDKRKPKNRKSSIVTKEKIQS